MGHGIKGIAPLECINKKIDKWRVRWNIQPVEEDENAVTFEEKEFTRKPTLAQIKETIVNWLNCQVDEKIISGFVWREMFVWLDSLNQFNYKSAYDLSFQNHVAGMPFQEVPVKFGTDEKPIYHTFKTFEEISEFYLLAIAHIQTCLAEGWEEKDNIDLSPYEELLNN